MIDWLHISDLHAGSTGADRRWNDAKLSIAAHFQSRVKGVGALLMPFTGDVAWSGNSTEYSIADSRVDEIEALLQRECIILPTPGNHDLDWAAVDDIIPSLVGDYQRNDTARHQVKTGSGLLADALKKPFEHYQSWFDKVRQSWEPYLVEYQSGKMPGDYAVLLEVAGILVEIHSVNTAFLHLDAGEYRGRLAVESEQVPALLSPIIPHLRFLLTHHPPTWLSEGAIAEYRSNLYRPDRYTAHLFGHAHAAEAVVERYAGYSSRSLIQANSLLGLEKYGTSNEDRRMGFTWGTVSRSADGRTAIRSTPFSVHAQNHGGYRVIPDPAQDAIEFFNPPGLAEYPRAKTAGPTTVPVANLDISPRSSVTRDRPPLLSTWVGRQSELETVRDPRYSVVAITGIPGQGKSYLAAKIIADLPDDRWFWGNCRDEKHTLHNRLSKLILFLGGGHVSAGDLRQQSTVDLVELAGEYLLDWDGIAVFDNIDQFVDYESGTPVAAVQQLLNAHTASSSRARLVVTARPRMRLGHPRGLEMPLSGLSYTETQELFRQLGPKGGGDETLRIALEAHAATLGHPMWLSMIASQLRVKPSIAKLVLDELVSERDVDLPTTVLDSVWKRLTIEQVRTIRVLAESVRPMAAKEVKKVSHNLSLRRVQSILDRLDDLSAVVKRDGLGDKPMFDLHPLVKAYARRMYPLEDRRGLIQRLVANIYTKQERPVQDWDKFAREKVELVQLHLNAENNEEALDAAWQVSDALSACEESHDFLAACDRLLKSVDWQEAVDAGNSAFHGVVRTYAIQLAHTGQNDEMQDLLKRYGSLLPQASAPFLAYCDCVAYTHWVVREHDQSIEWSERGLALLAKHGIDSDIDLLGTKALALRDSGRVDEAIRLFCPNDDLLGRLEEFDEDHERGHFFGNMARCLQMKGDSPDCIWPCLGASYFWLENDQDYMNIGFAALWAGYQAQTEGRWKEAAECFAAAVHSWKRRSVSRLAEVREAMDAFASMGAEQGTELEKALTLEGWRVMQRLDALLHSRAP